MSTRHSLTKTAFAYWQHYAIAGLGMIAAFALLSVPAVAIVWMGYPAAKALTVLAVLSFSLHTAAAFVRDVQQEEYEPGENADFVLGNVLLVLGIVVLYVVPLITTAAISGAYLSQTMGVPLVGLGVVLYYPVVDYELLKRGVPTPSSLPVLGLFALLHAIGLCRDISPQRVIRRFRRRPPMPRL